MNNFNAFNAAQAFNGAGGIGDILTVRFRRSVIGRKPSFYRSLLNRLLVWMGAILAEC